jgi:hypothetical protein
VGVVLTAGLSLPSLTGLSPRLRQRGVPVLLRLVKLSAPNKLLVLASRAKFLHKKTCTMVNTGCLSIPDRPGLE